MRPASAIAASNVAKQNRLGEGHRADTSGAGREPDRRHEQRAGLLNVPIEMQLIAKGLIIIVALTISNRRT